MQFTTTSALHDGGTRARNELLDDARQARYIWQRDALVEQLRSFLSRYEPGVPLPSSRVLAADLGSTSEAVVEAMRVLDIAGDVAYFGRGLRRSYRLLPHEHHPDDDALLGGLRRAVIERAASRCLPLPMQVLAHKYAASPHQMRRACQRLVTEQLIAFADAGWAGPGYYPIRPGRAATAPAPGLNTPPTASKESM